MAGHFRPLQGQSATSDVPIYVPIHVDFEALARTSGARRSLVKPIVPVPWWLLALDGRERPPQIGASRRRPCGPCRDRRPARSARSSVDPRPSVWLGGEAHEAPDEFVVDLLSLLGLGVDGEREPRICVAHLPHRPRRVASGEEAEAGRRCAGGSAASRSETASCPRRHGARRRGRRRREACGARCSRRAHRRVLVGNRPVCVDRAPAGLRRRRVMAEFLGATDRQLDGAGTGRGLRGGNPPVVARQVEVTPQGPHASPIRGPQRQRSASSSRRPSTDRSAFAL